MNKDELNAVKKEFERYRLMIEAYMAESAGKRAAGVPPKLFESMEYSLGAGGKRLRPVLCLAAAERCGLAAEAALPMALGLEMLHTATLIHDDLPCMDDDDMRRGKPSNHALFGETMAVLAGDALLAQSLSYPMTELKGIAAANILHAMAIFAQAIGPAGVCGGQVLDMDAEGGKEEADYVRRIAALKTGALIQAAVLAGAALGSDDAQLLKKYGDYALHLGSAFQIVDDILDVTSTAEELGKTPGKDSEQGKLTHVTVYGMDRAREMAEKESLEAKAALADILSSGDFLMQLPDYLVHRSF
ncbi:MAG: polyprenyl synthetase family protein [Synergistaceae bacterium]|nr:polyprenyl synthetase family protein [Synergistaceae bacterium]